MNLLGEAVHYHADHIVSPRLWQFSNQINTDDLPGFRGNVMGMDWVVGVLLHGLGPLAFLVSFNVLPDVLVHPLPPVVVGDQFMCLVPSWMPHQF